MSLLWIHTRMVQRHKAHTLWKVQGLPGPHFLEGGLLEKAELCPQAAVPFSVNGSQEGKEDKTSSLWISPESSSEPWPQHLHLRVHLLRITGSFAKASRVGKSITLFMQKQNFTNQFAFTHLALSLFWMMFKTTWNPCWLLPCQRA